ncbi:hypothetical protein WISP_10399 [Willisornis vidua]|uniref:Uncharacterized protein n=1 Tax=Willisornis vidua TaxID=1566151 RepID=A0ABQ9DX10_9PASS|nr:hypothetical protein WISP_10399 [Willisornis vidua]
MSPDRQANQGTEWAAQHCRLLDGHAQSGMGQRIEGDLGEDLKKEQMFKVEGIELTLIKQRPAWMSRELIAELRQAIPMPDYSLCKEFLSNIKPKPPLAELEPVPSSSTAGCFGEETNQTSPGYNILSGYLVVAIQSKSQSKDNLASVAPSSRDVVGLNQTVVLPLCWPDNLQGIWALRMYLLTGQEDVDIWLVALKAAQGPPNELEDCRTLDMELSGSFSTSNCGLWLAREGCGETL